MIVGIADLGIGNFAAMDKMLVQLGATPRRLSDPNMLADIDRLILPGVGAFDFAARQLDETGWREPLESFISQGHRPLLAVCVGMQLLVTSSDEGAGAGLNWIPGHCRKLVSPKDSPIKVPHMGWNALSVLRDDSLLDEFDRKQRFYFVHSYYVQCPSSFVLAECQYGLSFPAVIRRESTWGVQFHPEKSHGFGLNLLRNFLKFSC